MSIQNKSNEWVGPPPPKAADFLTSHLLLNLMVPPPLDAKHLDFIPFWVVAYGVTLLAINLEWVLPPLHCINDRPPKSLHERIFGRNVVLLDATNPSCRDTMVAAKGGWPRRLRSVNLVCPLSVALCHVRQHLMLGDDAGCPAALPNPFCRQGLNNGIFGLLTRM